MDSDSSDDDKKQPSPGPGSYLGSTHASSFQKIGQITTKLQSFGSQVNRFREHSKKATKDIGPGQYEINKLPLTKSTDVSSCFKTKNQSTIEKTIKDKEIIPGPGFYEKDHKNQTLEPKIIKEAIEAAGGGATAFWSNVERFP